MAKICLFWHSCGGHPSGDGHERPQRTSWALKIAGAGVHAYADQLAEELSFGRMGEKKCFQECKWWVVLAWPNEVFIARTTERWP